MDEINIGIVIPAHNEAMTITQCLASVQSASELLSCTIKATVLVVLDSCDDDTLALVKSIKANNAQVKNRNDRSVSIDYICCDYRCVGRVRDFGIRHTIASGATWIACTDADTVVEPDWLIQQIAHIKDNPTDMICGVVSVDSWRHLAAQTKADYMAHYQDKMGHRHIHGANLSFRAEAYLATGGFAPLPCHEDVDLVEKFKNKGYAITWSNRVRVITSSRLQARATEGFAAFLANLEDRHP